MTAASMLRLIGETDGDRVCSLRVLVSLCQAVLISRTLTLWNDEHLVHCTECSYCTNHVLTELQPQQADEIYNYTTEIQGEFNSSFSSLCLNVHILMH